MSLWACRADCTDAGRRRSLVDGRLPRAFGDPSVGRSRHRPANRGPKWLRCRILPGRAPAASQTGLRRHLARRRSRSAHRERAGQPDDRSCRCATPLDRLPAGIGGPGATSRGGWHGVSMPILPDGTLGVQGGGLLRSRPAVPARQDRSSGCGATARVPATCGIADVSAGKDAFVSAHPRCRPDTGATAPATRFRGRELPSERSWRRRLPSAKFRARRSCSPSIERNRTMARTKRSRAQLWCRRMGPDPGPGVPGSQDRPVPD